MKIIQDYFDAFNAGDIEGMLACLTDDVAHHVNERKIRRDKDLFTEFCAHMSRCYRENLTEMVIFANGDRAAAEYGICREWNLSRNRSRPAGGERPNLQAARRIVLRFGGRQNRARDHLL